MLAQVCNDVRVEHTLQTLTAENFTNNYANAAHDARLRISARGFWNKHQMAVFDRQRVFDPNSKSYENKTLRQCYVMNEKRKGDTTSNEGF